MGRKIIGILYREFSGALWVAPLWILWAWFEYRDGGNGGLQLLYGGIFIILYLIFKTIYRLKSSREK